MKLGFDAKRLFNNFTGLGNYSRFVVDALSTYYPEHEYLLYTPHLRDHYEIRMYLQNRFEIRKPESDLSKKFSAIWRSYALGNVAVNDGVEIFHGLSNELPVTKPTSLKTVVTVHDLIFKRFPEYYNTIDNLIYTQKLKAACASADVVVAISNQTASDLEEFMKVPAAKIKVVYQGCHTSFKVSVTEGVKQEVRNRYNLPQNYILYVGTLEQRKNALALLKAITLLKDPLPLVLVGKATPYTHILYDYIKANKLQQKISIYHQVAFADLPAIYQMAHVFVYPSAFEGFGIPIVEAIQSEVPVITSTGSCFEEAGGTGVQYVDPLSSEELAVQIERVSSEEDLRRSMIAISKQHVKKFEPPVIAQDLMRIYQSL